MPLKHSYTEMIHEALLTLAERKGSSRQAIWKVINTKYPEADYKQYLIRLKRVNPDEVAHEKARYRFTKAFREKTLKALKKGKDVVSAVKKTSVG